MKTIFLLPALILTVLVVTCCSSRSRDRELTRIAETVSNQPEEALKSLKAIDTLTLSEAQRHYYDFLTVKANDKAYITHTSDSLILRVIDYYSRHNRELYPEALYYGGRVYDDLGEKPLALRYFQDALEAMPEDTKDLDLKCRIQSQTARLLNSQGLYQEAIPYLEETIKISKEVKDTLNAVYDLQLLSATCIRAKEYEKADIYLKEALKFGFDLPKDLTAKTNMYRAQLKMKMNQIDSALSIIRKSLPYVSDMTRNTALACASNIYRKAGILDTAYNYGDQLIHSSDSLNREIGYQVILSPEIRKFVPIDSLDAYYDKYTTLLNSYYDHNQSQMTINQYNSYNYYRHENQKIKAEKDRDRFKTGFYIALTCIFILICALFLYRMIKKKNDIIHLQQILIAFDYIIYQIYSMNKMEVDRRSTSTVRVITHDHLPLSLPESTNSDEMVRPVESSPKQLPYKPTESEIREIVVKRLLTLGEECQYNIPISPEILNSEVYATLKTLAEEEKMMKKEMWDKVRTLVMNVAPHFEKRLQLLTKGKISKAEMQTALLVKVGMRTVDIQHLIGRSYGAVGSRKDTLSEKIFGKKTSQKITNAIIRLL